MKVLITGGGGVLGFKLAKALLARGRLTGAAGKEQEITRITLLDGAFPPGMPADPRLQAVTGDVSDAKTLESVVTPDTISAFHFAAVVSAGAEADFDLGMRVNLEGTRLLLERLRRCANPPRVVYTSSVAAFGGALPPVLDDSTTPTPQTSYGSQKVIGEYLLNDYSRKGFMDGRSLRLPTIVVRPGKPNLAASSFASAVIREPLNGIDYECPVRPESGVWLLSPRRCVEAFIHAHELPASSWPPGRVVNLPGITVPLTGMIGALRKVAGDKVADRVKWKFDARIDGIVQGWPTAIRTDRALAMGFKADADFESVIRQYIEDEGIKLPT
jgi:nucleoside-diphosphate-sugar epimerase